MELVQREEVLEEIDCQVRMKTLREKIVIYSSGSCYNSGSSQDPNRAGCMKDQKNANSTSVIEDC